MAKRFKSAEACDKEIDSMLAENITELFRNGIDEELVSHTIPIPVRVMFKLGQVKISPA